MNRNPWYREPWPWILMAGPAAVVVAGVVTTVVAVSTFDGVVADDYYKQGLAINRVIAREAAARRLGVSAAVSFGAERSTVRVRLAAGPPAASLRLVLVHPTLKGEDQAVLLGPVSPGLYEGRLPRAPRAATYRLQLEDGEGRWRLAGAWKGGEDAARLEP